MKLLNRVKNNIFVVNILINLMFSLKFQFCNITIFLIKENKNVKERKTNKKKKHKKENK